MKHLSPIQNALTHYEDACEDIADKFMEKYYVEGSEYPEHYWVGDEVGGVLSVNDEFWPLGDMVTALRLKVLPSKLFAWYYESLGASLKGGFPNLRNYLKLDS